MTPKEYKDFLRLHNVTLDNHIKIIFDLIGIVNDILERVNELEKKYASSEKS